MPNFDGRGPAGFGPMTGGGSGFCAVPVESERSAGYGRRTFYQGGRGGGRGWRNWYYATGMTGWQRSQSGYPAAGRGYGFDASPDVSPQDEERILKAQADNLGRMLADVNRRISEISAVGSPRDEKNEKKK